MTPENTSQTFEGELVYERPIHTINDDDDVPSVSQEDSLNNDAST